ncbi:hypothetical protein [Arthrobacter sp. NEB 688]|uniref:hypothetical protein n=1 Tax=Arthrobacter sp. NEB 688 TaxID=904039 RepID=UPI0015636E8D|nr:hypothetical protein [Arthrobacter sp. NEB 688]QKE84615.1 hypothetical protein HL663_12145 [Arthrobacter sp. NEB 688]
MAGSVEGDESRVLDAADSRIYGVVWLGLLAAAVGTVIGLWLALSDEGSLAIGAAVTATSVALGALVYLVSKVLDRL